MKTRLGKHSSEYFANVLRRPERKLTKVEQIAARGWKEGRRLIHHPIE
jgi:hypothetical protein